jgi:hypothetical protein
MDTLSHVVYGATLCSRSGLTGGRRGFRGGSIWSDWTVWAAAGFGLLPDALSIGIAFVRMAVSGAPVSFHAIPPYVFVLYRLTHSLIVAGLFVLLVRMVSRRAAVPALAWPAHILMDSVSHGEGRWQTPMLFPVSDWHFHGINWWEHPNVVLFYWGILPLMWIAIRVWRWKSLWLFRVKGKGGD